MLSDSNLNRKPEIQSGHCRWHRRKRSTLKSWPFNALFTIKCTVNKPHHLAYSLGHHIQSLNSKPQYVSCDRLTRVSARDPLTFSQTNRNALMGLFVRLLIMTLSLCGFACFCFQSSKVQSQWTQTTWNPHQH